MQDLLDIDDEEYKSHSFVAGRLNTQPLSKHLKGNLFLDTLALRSSVGATKNLLQQTQTARYSPYTNPQRLQEPSSLLVQSSGGDNSRSAVSNRVMQNMTQHSFNLQANSSLFAAAGNDGQNLVKAFGWGPTSSEPS